MPENNLSRKCFTMIDLFAGAGGLSHGFRMAGFLPIFAVEFDKDAAESYRANNPGAEVFIDDIHKVISFGCFKADIIIGGPPCQGFSPLGKMSTQDARRDEHQLMNSLCMEFLRAVREVRPSAFVMENVPEFLRSAEFDLFGRLVRAEGYDIRFGVLKAEEFGVPQRRRRGFTVGILNGLSSLPQPAGEIATVREAIGDLPLEPGGSDPLHIARNPTQKSLERYSQIPPGGNRFDLMKARPDICPRCWLEKKTGSTDVFGRLEWDKPALTIRTEFFKPEKGRYLHPQADRPITHREAARLQTFPDTYVFKGSKIEIAKQIGNAVPPKLAYYVALHVKHLLEIETPVMPRLEVEYSSLSAEK